MEERLTIKQQRELKKRQKLERRAGNTEERRSSIKFGGILAGLVVVMIGGFILGSRNSKPSQVSGDVVSQTGIHWHPQLDIYIKGEKQAMPSNLGAGSGGHGAIHTHDSSGQLHWEFAAGPVMKDQLKLARFFSTWGKPFNSSQLLEQKADEGVIAMTVNGQGNNEFENYQIKDGDKIEIKYD